MKVKHGGERDGEKKRFRSDGFFAASEKSWKKSRKPLSDIEPELVVQLKINTEDRHSNSERRFPQWACEHIFSAAARLARNRHESVATIFLIVVIWPREWAWLISFPALLMHTRRQWNRFLIALPGFACNAIYMGTTSDSLALSYFSISFNTTH